jgi:hypothetical protein
MMNLLFLLSNCEGFALTSSSAGATHAQHGYGILFDQDPVRLAIANGGIELLAVILSTFLSLNQLLDLFLFIGACHVRRHTVNCLKSSSTKKYLAVKGITSLFKH